ncbi:ech hydrogenase subunit A [Maridesulfovibrio ferrireducens]|uniref:Ech hydrogenase subunit A n=1 Tax=Maridesulfovibrio ferrireducens TaxID=246191 RepID=A0A1G9KJD7_9BACT|nr:proton-conducting transporter membrane subunit [Maridesulfovibrio ferrireducens]SDL49706.1 ech hydrogenase subunit A [Maridesulfovibrio ferrireducens]
MLPMMLALVILLPLMAAIGCYFLRVSTIRSMIVLVTGVCIAVTSLVLLGQGSFTYSPGTLLGISWDSLVTLADFSLLFVILYYAFKLKNQLIKVFAVLQIIPLAVFELFFVDHAAEVPAFYADSLALIMVAVISIIGSLICIFAIPYMKEHEEHLHLVNSRQPRFFFYLVLFLGAMNGLVLSNNILWLYFFFEVTTFCSFMLIAHDDTEIAVKNATRALWMNSLGGVAFVFGMIWAYTEVGSLSLQTIIEAGPMGGAMLVPIGLLCLAGFTKAAQLPFQSWLLGAMVAPTPVSALLHSSTMVKAGVYIVLRLAPAYAGTFLSEGIALCGAFTFLACAAIAISQSNGKKVLAYSTISNLGLIICCAGLNTPWAITAAIILIIFHAGSKALLFLCVGTIEHGIGSRDIDDMHGLYLKMPRTAIITIIGVLTMILPPFGVLLGKWMAIEAASGDIFVIVMLALGSALSLVFWARWAGILLTAPLRDKVPAEIQSPLTKFTLTALAAGTVILSLFSPVIYTGLIEPMIGKTYEITAGVFSSPVGVFAVYPIFFILAAAFVYAWIETKKSGNIQNAQSYMCGANVKEPGVQAFIGPMNQPVALKASNYYLKSFFGEEKLTLWINFVALALIVLMLGGAL